MRVIPFHLILQLKRPMCRLKFRHIQQGLYFLSLFDFNIVGMQEQCMNFTQNISPKLINTKDHFFATASTHKLLI